MSGSCGGSSSTALLQLPSVLMGAASSDHMYAGVGVVGSRKIFMKIVDVVVVGSKQNCRQVSGQGRNSMESSSHTIIGCCLVVREKNKNKMGSIMDGFTVKKMKFRRMSEWGDRERAKRRNFVNGKILRGLRASLKKWIKWEWGKECLVDAPPISMVIILRNWIFVGTMGDFGNT